MKQKCLSVIFLSCVLPDDPPSYKPKSVDWRLEQMRQIAHAENE